jgi:hypothetical protein
MDMKKILIIGVLIIIIGVILLGNTYFMAETHEKTNLTITEELKIAHTKNDITNFTIFEQLFKIKNPLKCRVFKIANISFSGFSWTLSNEQWIKAK